MCHWAWAARLHVSTPLRFWMLLHICEYLHQRIWRRLCRSLAAERVLVVQFGGLCSRAQVVAIVLIATMLHSISHLQICCSKPRKLVEHWRNLIVAPHIRLLLLRGSKLKRLSVVSLKDGLLCGFRFLMLW